MPNKRGRKQKKAAELPESSGQTQTTAEVDHAFAGTDTGKKKLDLRHTLTGKQWLIAGGVLLVLIGLGGYAVWQNKPEPEPEKLTLTSEGVELRKLNSEALQKELEKLIFEKRFSSAEQLINYQDDADSYESRMLLVAVYMNQDKPDQALRVLQDMEKKYPDDWQVARTTGDLYQRLGDNAKALASYKKSLDLLKKDDDVPVRDDEISFLEQDIKRLEGQQ